MFETATEYFNSLADLQMKRLLQQRNSIETEGEAESKFLNRIHFKRAVCDFVDPSWDNGPFVLVLRDLSPQNILVDENGSVKAILDLEWTSVRPVQSIGPPVWLSGIECGDVIFQDEDKLKKFESRLEHFIKIFERQEDLRLKHQSTSPGLDTV
jgi:serine/threonine protein kinase